MWRLPVRAQCYRLPPRSSASTIEVGSGPIAERHCASNCRFARPCLRPAARECCVAREPLAPLPEIRPNPFACLARLERKVAARSAGFGECLAVDSRLTLQVIDGDVGVVPGEPGSNAKAAGQFNDALLSEPCLGASAALPEVDAPGAAVTVEVVLSDQALCGKTAVDGCSRRTTLHGLLLGSFRQVELDDDDTIAHTWLLHSNSAAPASYVRQGWST